MKEIANKLAVSEGMICNWFSRKRSQLKKETTQTKLLDRKYIAPLIGTYFPIQENFDFCAFLACLHMEHVLYDMYTNILKSVS